jgi:hypothetical protein
MFNDDIQFELVREEVSLHDCGHYHRPNQVCPPDPRCPDDGSCMCANDKS